MPTSLLIELLEEFADKMAEFSNFVIREAVLPNVPNKIKTIIGMRRTGKTHFILQVIKNLLDQVSLEQILYLNFEDDRLIPCTQEKLRELIDNFYSLYPENHQRTCYFFFDEIQNVENWAVLIRRYFDTKKVQIYLTGSSSKLLSKEIATSLRGRALATEIWPLSFKEFLASEEIVVPTNLGKRSLDELKSNLLTYLNHGGFPEILHYEISDRIQTLQDYVNVVIFKDIVERHDITNIALVKYLIKTLIINAGKLFTVNKFFNDLKSQGLAIAKNTLYNYLNYIEDTFLTFSVPLHANSIRKIQANPKKIYAIDPGLICAYTLGFQTNLGHLFENLIYLDLKRKKHEIYYYVTNSGYEVDFLTKDLFGKWYLYQVAWDIDDKETLARETRALQEAEKELKITGKLITPDFYLTNWLKDMDDPSFPT